MVYDGVHVIADLDSAGGLVRSYVWGPGVDNMLSMTVYGTSTNTYYAVKDHLGSVLAMTDSNGNIAESYRYDAWGRTTVYSANGVALKSSAIGNRYCWQGREYSFKTGLYYFRARFYDPVAGRWLSNDPIGISGGLNQYVFCGNNPVNFRDPMGTCKKSSGLDWFQGGLDVVGVFDPFGVADGLNALIYLGRGQNGNAAISGLGMIPFIGDLGKVGKYGSKIVKASREMAAPEKVAIAMGNQIEKDISKEARRDFHDLENICDRTMQQLREDVKYIYEGTGKVPPKWMQ